MSEKMNSAGVERLKQAVLKDCNARNHSGCFNPNGCDKPNASNGTKRCFHRYCDKFKWVLDRAEHYSNITGLTQYEIIDSWEKNRNCGYLHYYQNEHQPLIEEGQVRVFATINDLNNSIGNDGFRCPLCKEKTNNPYRCDSGNVTSSRSVCDWSVGGLLGHMGKGISVFVKEETIFENLFMPIAWEKDMHHPKK